MTIATIGTPVLHSDMANHRVGHIVAIHASNGFLIGGNGLEPVRSEYEIIFHDAGQPNSRTKVTDATAEPWIDKAAQAQIRPISEAEAVDLLAGMALVEATRHRDQSARRELADQARAAFVADAAARLPNWAQAVIIAQLVEDRSDLMSDYHGSTTTRTIILGFSSHKRDLFPEMRKMARNHPETASLADAPPAAEHREKYSMGAGFYLKDGYRDSNGWKVSKSTIYNGADSIPTGEWSLEPAATGPAASGAPASVAMAGGYRVEDHYHAKREATVSIVVLGDRVDRDRFEQLRGAAKDAGGWYSRAWSKTPAGFAFPTREAAEAFAADQLGGEAVAAAAPAQPAGSAPTRSAPAGLADKFRGFADAMQSAIDDKFRDRRNNTPKQQREAQSARLDGYQLQRAQRALRMLADHHEAGTVPAELATVRSKSEIMDLARADIDSSGGYYDAGHETGKPARDTEAARALWAMVGGTSAADVAAEQLRQKVDGLKFAKIPGFFPTPAGIVAQMIEAARLPEGPFVMLEPSAGTAAILDAVTKAAPDASFMIYEQQFSLREILEAKGYQLTGFDFTESDTGRKVQRVLMNPPFEKGQDIDHVRRAFDHLEDGGRLVSIMSSGPFFRDDRRSREFRDWFDDLGGEKVELLAGAFKESGTGVGSCMVIIDRDGSAGDVGPGDGADEPEGIQPTGPDLRDIKAHETAKRALEIAAAGELSIFLRGDEGQGKSMLIEAAKALGDFNAEEGRRQPMANPHDIYVDLCPVAACDQVLPCPAEGTAAVRARVDMAKARLEDICPGFAGLSLATVAAVAERLADENGRRLMSHAIEAMRLSPLRTAQVYRAALAIAALAGDIDRVSRICIAEALSYVRQVQNDPEKRLKSSFECHLIRRAWAMRAALRAKPAGPLALGLSDRVRLLQGGYEGEAATVIPRSDVDRYAMRHELLFLTNSSRHLVADPRGEGTQWERIEATAPAPPTGPGDEPSGLLARLDRLERLISGGPAGEISDPTPDLVTRKDLAADERTDLVATIDQLRAQNASQAATNARLAHSRQRIAARLLRMRRAGMREREINNQLLGLVAERTQVRALPFSPMTKPAPALVLPVSYSRPRQQAAA